LILNKKKQIKINLKYVTNFTPNLFFKTAGIRINKFNNKFEKINCKNFFLFFIILKNMFKNNKVSFFVKPKKSPIQNILRAPYKNKKSKHQLTFSRYYFNVSVIFVLKKINFFKNTNQLIYLTDELKKFYSFFESNICFQHKSTILFFFYLNDFFFI
jgi:hypothetical protein